jgi:TetR/AcrR family transcriptional regulator of autoinduction and epiphytic fitness
MHSSPAPSAPAAGRLTDRKRAAIVAAAVEAFRAHGFEATSMDAIAAGAGVSKRTVYNHFPSKDELFAEILMQLFAASAAQIEQPYRADVPLRTQLIEMMGAKMRMLADPNFLDVARVAIAEGIHAPERARAIVARLNEREEGFNNWIRAAQADRRLRAGEPSFLATVLQGQIKTFAFWPQVAMGAPPLDAATQAQVTETAVAMFLAHFGAPAGAGEAA